MNNQDNNNFENDLKKLDKKLGHVEDVVEKKVDEIHGEIEDIDEEIGLKTEKVAQKTQDTIEKVAQKSQIKIDRVDDKIESVKADVKEIKSDVHDLSKATKALFKIFNRSHNYLLNHYAWYYKWHTNPASSPTHWAGLLFALTILFYIFGFQLGFFGGQKPVVSAAAGINKMINYQGKLTDNSDIPVADGSYEMKFSIYDVDSGGTPLWTCQGVVGAPDHIHVTVANGIFSVGLGAAAAGGACDKILSLDFNSDTYYLGVTVGADSEMSPRKRLGAVGYAYNSDTVDGKNETDFALLAGRSGSQVVIGGTVANETLTLQGNSAVAANTAANANIIFNVGNSGATTAMTILNNGLIGIGTATLATGEKLAVSNGSIKLGVFPGYMDAGADANAVTLDIPESKTLRVWDNFSISGNVFIGSTNATAGAPLDIQQAPVSNIVIKAGKAGSGTPRYINFPFQAGDTVGIQFGDDNNKWSNTWGGPMVFGSYWAMDFGGYAKGVYTTDLGETAITARFRISQAAAVGLVVKGAGSQTGDLQQWQNSGGTSLVVVDAAGKVGIGDSTPSSSLEVGNGTDSIQIGSTGDITFIDANDASSVTGPAGGALSIVSGTAQNIALNPATTGDILFTLDTDGSILDINDTANTTGSVVDISSTVLTSGKAVDIQVSGTAAAASQTALNILTAGANGTVGITTYGAQISNTHTNVTSGTNIALYLNASGATTANYGLIVNAGNVGIGTTTPANRLAIDQNGAGSDDWTWIQLLQGGSQAATIRGDAATNAFVIRGNYTTVVDDLVTITQTGFVGIGDKTPAAMLTVGNGDKFQVDSNGVVTAVGVNSGAGLLQGALGLTITGAITSLNASSNFATNINTGTSTGTVTIGGTAGNTINIGTDNSVADTIAIGSALDSLALSSAHFAVTSAGAVSGVTTLGLSGAISGQTVTNTINGAIINGSTQTLSANNIADSGALTIKSTSANLALQTATSGNITLAPASTGSVQLTSGVTTGTTTSSGLSVAANSLTAGNALYVASTSLTDGSLAYLTVNGTAAANTQKALEIYVAGANSTGDIDTYGLYANNSHTGISAYDIGGYFEASGSGDTSTNVAGYFKAAGATNNYGLIVSAGDVGIGTTTPSGLLDVYSSQSHATETPRRTVGGTVLTAAVDYNAGYKFTVNADGQITALSALIHDTGTDTVRLYNSVGTVLASASVTGVVDTWVTTSITPVSVAAGNWYVVAVHDASHITYSSTATPTTTGNITINEGRYLGASNAIPTSVNNASMNCADITFVQSPPASVLAVTSNHNVGIGTTSPSFALQVQETSYGSESTPLFLNNRNTGVIGNAVTLAFGAHGSDTVTGAITNYVTGSGTYDLLFKTYGSATLSEKMRITSAGKVGIGRVPTTRTLEVEGDAGLPAAGGWLAYSDARIKTDIQPVDNAISTIMNLKPVKFKYTDWYMSQHPSIKNQYYYNYIAQDFAKVFPDSVKGSSEYLPDGSEILQMDSYDANVVAISAIQEQQQEIENLQQGLSLIQGELDGNLAVNNLEVKDKIITQDIEIKGHIVGSHDTRGVVTIPAGKTEAEFVFDTLYLIEPLIVATQKITCEVKNEGKVCGAISDGNYALEIYQDKFIVHIKQAYDYDLTFSWQAQQ